MISLDAITVEFGGTALFKDITFLIKDTDRIGLTGKNGAGKSTLLKIITGNQEPTSGKVNFQKNIKVGYLAQEIECENDKTVYLETKTAVKEINDLNDEIDRINHQLEIRTDYESDGYIKLIEKLDDCNHRLINFGVNNIDAEIEKILLGLGFSRDEFDRPTSELSGGWRMRIELAKILLQKPNVLLLDEPTNHLDIESIQWFENFLKSNKIALLLISHDRRFLDSITNRTVEISMGKIYDYSVSYSKYLVQRELRLEQQVAAYKNQQKIISDTQQFIDRFRYQATKSSQVQSRVKMLDKMDVIEIDETENSALNIKFADFKPSGQIIFESEDLTKSYGKNTIINDVNLTINRGEKIAFIGKNGEGKSTLVKIIMDVIDFEGTVKLGHNVNIGYFAQDQASQLDVSKTVFQTVDDIATGDNRTKVRSILGSFLFSGENIDKKVSILSGGEKTRLAMIQLLLQPYNVLILDEPTNHLDITSKEILKSALKNYKGTVIIVSHDRHFLDGLCDKILIFRDKKVKEHLGSIDDFLNSLSVDAKISLKSSSSAKQKPLSDNKLLYEARKKVEKEIRKVKKLFDTCEANIERLELDIQNIEIEMNNNCNEDIFIKHGKLKQELDDNVHKWEIYSINIEELEEKKENL